MDNPPLVLKLPYKDLLTPNWSLSRASMAGTANAFPVSVIIGDL